jgi:hypothetical protein
MVDPLPNAPVDGIDPNVKLPPSVMQSSRLAMEAHARAYPTGQGPNGAPPPNGAAPAPNGAAPAPSAPPAEGELPEVNADGTPNWENRFRALKGRYDSDTRRSRETLEQYEQRVREMNTQLQRASQRPLPGSQPPPRLVTDKEVEDYGPDLIDVMRRVAQESTLPLLTPLATELGHVKARVDTTEGETGRQFLSRMHSTMDSSVPGWQQLNEDPNFIAWTKRSDVYSGLNRQELLQKAWYAGDSNRVAAFFNGFLAEEAATDPAAAQARQQANGAGYEGHATAPAPSPHAQASRVTLESLAAPGRARAAAMAPAGKPTWTAEGISTFYMDIANGKFRGRDAERLATEADLMAAQREGRIVINPRTATQLG